MNVPPAVASMAIISLCLHATTFAMLGWSAAIAVRYVASVQLSSIVNGRRIAAYAIAWRAAALGAAVTGTAIGATLILLSDRDLDLSADLWRAGSLLTVSFALAALAVADVYERVALSRSGGAVQQ